MKPIIEPISKEILEKELNQDVFVRPANNGHNLIYIINCHNAPNVMLEIGRLREISFRKAGGGTGKECDVDEFDYGDKAYNQLIVWDPIEKEIVGGYRYVLTHKTQDESGFFHLATTEIYEFSDKMKSHYLQKTIELGRSFVQPNYQPTVNNRKGLFSLDNLWDGLGALVVLHPEMEYFYGKVTMYRHFNVNARDMILAFMHYFFPDKEGLVKINDEVKITTDTSEFLKSIEGLEYKKALNILSQRVRDYNEHVPPLVNAYMNTSPTMKTFPTCINTHFGDVEETGIMVTIKDIYDSKRERHVQSYLNYLSQKSN